eukprot:6411709-Amphidinium_carterae.1
MSCCKYAEKLFWTYNKCLTRPKLPSLPPLLPSNLTPSRGAARKGVGNPGCDQARQAAATMKQTLSSPHDPIKPALGNTHNKYDPERWRSSHAQSHMGTAQPREEQQGDWSPRPELPQQAQ